MATPPLGCITAAERNAEQAEAHDRATAKQIAFALAPQDMPVGFKIMLTDSWKHPKVVADVGFEFNGMFQFTGSCVGVSSGNAVFTLGAVQRCLPENPTKAFVPWWPYNYGRTRYEEGDRGQGEGAVVSVMLEVLKQGVFAENEKGLPTDLPDFTRTEDGMQLSKQVEMKWSDGAKIDPTLKELARKFPIGSVAKINDADGIATALINGYPVNDGCDYFCQHGFIKGSGDVAYVRGKYDGRGGHATCFLGYWKHPNDGELFLYSNQWQTMTYPKDPAGGGRCCVWLPRSEVDRAFDQLGMRGECGAISSLNYFPAQPDIPDALINWSSM